ncbi:hypothetical protein JCM10207_007202 [Rhodosporidiobolus poonsookiae]
MPKQVPLTTLDGNLDQVALTLAFVFRLSANEDGNAVVEQVKASSERVVRKWPVLAGTPRLGENGRWTIEVPDDLDSLDRPLVYFTTTDKSDTPYHHAAGLDAPQPDLADAPSGGLPGAVATLFRHPSAVRSLGDFVKQNRSVVQIHTTLLADSLAIGVSVAHGICDGKGMGLVLKAITAELHNQPWDVPPIYDGTNPFAERLQQLVDDQRIKAEDPTPAVYRGLAPISVGGGARFASATLVETTYWKGQWSSLFFKQDALDYLVQKTKEEVRLKTGGKEYVSAGDILIAWLMKSAHADEIGTGDSVEVDAVFNIRDLLDTYSNDTPAPPFKDYPYNCLAFYHATEPPIPLSTLGPMPLTDFALHFRRNLLMYRTLPSLAEFWRQRGLTKPALHVPVDDGPQIPPSLPFVGGKPFTHKWFLSNHMQLGMADLAVPGKDGKDLPLMMYYLIPELASFYQRNIGFQQLKEGVMVGTAIRKSRWESVLRALAEVEREKEEHARRV